MLQRPYFPALDALRFYAALSVVVSHVAVDLGAVGDTIRLFFLEGITAVMLFFTLSAFLITLLLLHERERHGDIAVRKFYIRRALRILPLYVLTIVLTVVLLPDQRPTEAVAYLALLLLSPQLVGPLLGVLGHLWSIGMEEWFYFAFPPLFRRFSIPLIAAGLVVFKLIVIGLGSLVFDLSRAEPGSLLWSIVSWRFEAPIALGMLAAWMVYTQHPLRPAIYRLSPLWIGVFLLQLPFFFQDTLINSLLLGIVFSALIMLAVDRPTPALRRIPPLIVDLGKLTYGIYMYHPLIYWLLASVMPPSLLFALVVTGVTIGVAAVSYRVFEQPFLKRKPYTLPRPALAGD